MATRDILFSRFQLGPLSLPNRIVMAPLTRSRAGQPGDVPGDLNAEYYRQRAGAGLIIAEATQVSPQGKGYAYTPGIYSDAQVAGWRKVTSAVHSAGGRILLQLWHVGRISHPSLQPDGALPVAPSAVRPEGVQAFLGEAGFADIPTPRALEAEELPGIVEQFRRGAENARRAGFDGVEVHGANGYLIDQFLRADTNRRTDEFGGSLENRLRFPLMVMDAAIGVWGADRVGIRISPTGTANGMRVDDPVALMAALARALDARGIAFMEMIEEPLPREPGRRPRPVIEALRRHFRGVYIANRDYSADEARDALLCRDCELVSFGKPFISNPDLPRRFHGSAPLNGWDTATFYGGGARGYTDYPTLDEQEG